MSEEIERAKTRLLKLADEMCIQDVREDVARYGLGMVLSVWKRELMETVEVLDEQDSL